MYGKPERTNDNMDGLRETEDMWWTQNNSLCFCDYMLLHEWRQISTPSFTLKLTFTFHH